MLGECLSWLLLALVSVAVVGVGELAKALFNHFTELGPQDDPLANHSHWRQGQG
jgi:hypothetical protein